jgi:hypothetical protein
MTRANSQGWSSFAPLVPLRLMEAIFKNVLLSFETANESAGYETLLLSLSSNDTEPIILRDFEIFLKIIHFVSIHLQRQGGGASVGSSSTSSSLQMNILEVIAWFYSADFCYDSSLRQALASHDPSHQIVQSLLTILINQTSYHESVIGHILFIFATNSLPELFSPYAASLLQGILTFFPTDAKNTLRKYALRALIGLLRTCPSVANEISLEFHHLNLMSELMDEACLYQTEVCDLINLWPWKYSDTITSCATQQAKQLMTKLKSETSPSCLSLSLSVPVPRSLSVSLFVTLCLCLSLSLSFTLSPATSHTFLVQNWLKKSKFLSPALQMKHTSRIFVPIIMSPLSRI